MLGFFDSGVGGLTILESVHRLLPEYDTLYLGDLMRSPFGEKTHEQLVAFTWQAAEWFFQQGCPLVIIACNSASSSALREIQQTKLSAYPGKRILGVIRPTVEELSKKGFRKIAVLSTLATKASGAYVKEFEKINPDIRVISHACPSWVPMIEEGFVGTPEMRAEVEKEIFNLEKVDKNFDAVLLACTHYPYLKDEIERALSRRVPVFDQGGIVARSLVDYLRRHPEIEAQLGKNQLYRYATTGDASQASRIASERFGFGVSFEHVEL